jgi:hypothetical protein
VLSSAPSDRAVATLMIGMAADPSGEPSRCSDPGLEQLRRGNPAARSLPLLVMLAARLAGRVRLDLSHGSLDIVVTPC